MLASIVSAGFNPQADFSYVPDFLPVNTANTLMERLWTGLQWRQQAITLFGRSVLQPRLTCWYGDPDANYAYSGLQLEPLPWHPDLLELRSLLQERFECGVNSVLANAYRDGRDSMGWHADNEEELGSKPFIASLSLGASRRFLLREKRGSSCATVCLPLDHGSLLVMQNNSQLLYRHAVPKTAKPVGPRINLTFRQIFKS